MATISDAAEALRCLAAIETKIDFYREQIS
jgi:hypothetical protein